MKEEHFLKKNNFKDSDCFSILSNVKHTYCSICFTGLTIKYSILQKTKNIYGLISKSVNRTKLKMYIIKYIIFFLKYKCNNYHPLYKYKY